MLSLQFVPRHALRLALPVPCGKNKAFDWLKSINGKAWLVQSIKNYTVGMTRHDACLAYIMFSDGIFTVHYACHIHRDFHGGMAGPNAKKYRGASANELGLIVRRFDIRRDDYGMARLIKKNFEIFCDI